MSEHVAVVDGTVDNPCHDTSRRARNWGARVWRNEAVKGGLEREFLTRGHSSRVVLPADLEPGHVLEMAGDRLSGNGRRSPHRQYWRIAEYCPDTAIGYDAIDVGDVPPRPEGRCPHDAAPTLCAASLPDLLEELKRRGVVAFADGRPYVVLPPDSEVGEE